MKLFEDIMKQQGIAGLVYFIVEQPPLQMKSSLSDSGRNVNRQCNVLKFDSHYV